MSNTGFSLKDTFWSGETGTQIKKCGKDAQILALYLMSNPSANRIGLYFFTYESVSRHTALSAEEAKIAMKELVDLNFCAYEDETGLIFVKKMIVHQYGHGLKHTDNNVSNINKMLAALPNNNRLVREFVDMYKHEFFLFTPDNMNVYEEFFIELAKAYRKNNHQFLGATLFTKADDGLKKCFQAGYEVAEILEKGKWLYQNQSDAERRSIRFSHIYFSIAKGRQTMMDRGNVKAPESGRKMIEPAKYEHSVPPEKRTDKNRNDVSFI